MIPVEYELKMSTNDTWSMDRQHFHEKVEFLLPVSDGEGLFVDNEIYPLRRGTLFVLQEGTLHKTTASASYRRYVLHVEPQVLEQLSTPKTDFVRRLQHCGRAITLGAQTDTVAQLFRDLDRPEKNGFGGDIQRCISFLEFLTTVFALPECLPPARAKPFDPTSEKVSAILRYIQDHLSERLSLDRIAGELYISKYYLGHLFKATTGFSVIEYVIHCRILRAQQLLRAGMQVQETGEQVGFESNEHFIRTFGALTGVSPKQYSKKYTCGDKT